MKKRMTAVAALMALAVSTLATAGAQSASQATTATERVSFTGSQGTVTVYSNSQHKAVRVSASSSKLNVRLVSHVGTVAPCAKQCVFKTPFSWGSVSYRSAGHTVTQLNQAIIGERHLPQIRPYKGKDSFVYAGAYGVSRIVLTSAHDVTFCQAIEAFPGYFSFKLKNGKTVTCPTDKSFGFTTVVPWVSVSVYYTGADKPQKTDTLYRADVEAANR